MTVSGNWTVWLGCPDESATATLMLYAVGAAVLGTLSVTVRVAAALGLIATGLAGENVHCAPGIEPASHVAFTEPL